MSPSEFRFPSYTDSELAADRVVHFVGVPAAVVSAVLLFARADETGDPRLIVTISLYGVALIATLSLSAAYNLCPPCRRKEILRRADHAMIFAMIAATYTPFALNTLDAEDGIALCAVVWLLALGGIFVKLTKPYRYENTMIGLYLGMGWLIIGLIRTFIERLPEDALILLLAGGLVLSVGAFVHTRERLPYHNAAWHVLVLIGAGLHVQAVRAAFLTGNIGG
ncbi:Hemolysin III family protein [Rhodovastum atsumiense]|uniref:Hemolysin III family protein n=1 Tax=Rhodovastum atsumiense TaxID=504468 RepID=A0A5M6J224_9PROT|nr:hemolysin III family protein [Rhodovastum atsumiense]KAA5613648.1 hemolysin III family protein [Rhodovastum atsumiense]CAH2599555.1 Hemolysin III family protein [Rhodovastum atsumiense]